MTDPGSSRDYNRPLGQKLSPQTPYLVMLGDVGTGKSTVVEKLTEETGRSSDGSLSFTRSSEPFWTYDNTMVICDTPGSNALQDRLEHNIHIAHAFNFNPVWRILIIAKADTRIDNVVENIRKYAERLLDLPMELLAALVTHMDTVTWKPEEFQEHLEQELGIESAAFSGINTPREVLLEELRKLCEGGHKIAIDDENFLKVFKINDNRLKIIRSTNREVDEFKKLKADFDRQREVYKGKDLTDLIFEFQGYMRQEIIEAQKRVSEENGFTFYGEKGANEAGHIANMVNQMRVVLYDIRVEAARHQSDHGVTTARRCIYCNLIWTKVEGCNGATTCGNRPTTAIDVRDPSYGVLGTYTFKRLRNGVLNILKSGQRAVKSSQPMDKSYGCGKTINWNELPVVSVPEEVRVITAITLKDDIPVLSDSVPGATSFKKWLRKMLSPYSCGMVLSKRKPKK